MERQGEASKSGGSNLGPRHGLRDDGGPAEVGGHDAEFSRCECDRELIDSGSTSNEHPGGESMSDCAAAEIVSLEGARAGRRPDDRITARLSRVLSADPGASVLRLAREVGVSVNTVRSHLRRIPAAVERHADASERLALDGLDLCDAMAEKLAEVAEVIADLRREKARSTRATDTLLRAFLTFDRLARSYAALSLPYLAPRQSLLVDQIRALCETPSALDPDFLANYQRVRERREQQQGAACAATGATEGPNALDEAVGDGDRFKL